MIIYKTCLRCGSVGRSSGDTALDYVCPKCLMSDAKAEARNASSKKVATFAATQDSPDFAPTQPSLNAADTVPSSSSKVGLFGDVNSWFYGSLYLMVVATGFYTSHSIEILLSGIVMACLIFPPTRSSIKRTRGYVPGKFLTLVLVVLIGFWQHGRFLNGVKTQQELQEAAARQVISDKLAMDRGVRLKYFEINKPAIMADMQAKLDAGKTSDVLAVAAKYIDVTHDPDLVRNKRSAELMAMRVELKDESKLTDDRRLSIYTALSEVDTEFAEKKETLVKAIESARNAELIRRGNDQIRERQIREASGANFADCKAITIAGDAMGLSVRETDAVVRDARFAGTCRDNPNR